MGDTPTRIVIADTGQANCEALGRALARYPDFRLVGYAFHTSDLLRLAIDHDAHIAVVRENLNEGRRSGLAAIQQLARSHPETRSLLLAESLERDDVVSAFQSAARGIMQYPVPDLDMLAKAVKQINNGQIWANSLQLQYLVETLSQIKRSPIVTADAEALLSKREQEVLMLLAEGFSNKEIAASLHVSEHTVKNHLFRMFEKLGVSSRMEAVLAAFGSPASLPRPTIQ
ncbi:MAG TPA: response regulator transcription factor [Acidisarcina sp.]|nr:response regulator transcription factor [Acidisarcina sp.]